MNLFQYVGTKKLNELVITGDYQTGSTTLHDVTKGPDRFAGLLGSEYELSERDALKLSNTTIGTLYGCTIKMVRVQPDFGTVLLTDILKGRPLFWNDTKKFFVTPLASATARLAGIAIGALTSANAKGDIIPIVVAGDVGVLLAASLTKASPVANDRVSISIAASLATVDVLADATAVTQGSSAAWIGRVIEAWNGAAGTVKKMYLDGAYRIPDPGIKH